MKPTEITGVLGVIIASLSLLTAIIVANIAKSTFERGPVPEKSLSYRTLAASDTLSAFKNATTAISVSVNAEGKPLHNLYVVTSCLTNDGHAPILPDDIFENISLKTVAPWEIIAVTNQPSNPQNIAFEWSRASETEFRAQKALINPGDIILATVFLTHPDDDKSQTPPLSWSARISNLPAIQIQPPKPVFRDPGVWPLVISVYGNGILSLLASFAIYFTAYCYLLQANGCLLPWDKMSILKLVGSSLISLCAAEAGNTYLYGANILAAVPISHSLNLPWLVGNWLILAYLFWRFFQIRSQQGGNTAGVQS